MDKMPQLWPPSQQIPTFAIDDPKNHTGKAQKHRKQGFKTDPLSEDQPPQTGYDRRICCKQNVVRRGPIRRIAANRKKSPITMPNRLDKTSGQKCDDSRLKDRPQRIIKSHRMTIAASIQSLLKCSEPSSRADRWPNSTAIVQHSAAPSANRAETSTKIPV